MKKKKLPDGWWGFLPIWLFFPAFFITIYLLIHVNPWLAFAFFAVYLLISAVILIPINRNGMSVLQVWFWTAIGTIGIGIPALVLMRVVDFWLSGTQTP